MTLSQKVKPRDAYRLKNLTWLPLRAIMITINPPKMIDLKITLEDLPSAVPGRTIKIATFVGQLDSSNVEEKKVMFDEIIGKNPKNFFLIFDFEKLTYMNSRAIGCLAECHESVEKGGGKIVIARPPENVHDILRVVGIDKFVPVYPTLEAAKQAFAS